MRRLTVLRFSVQLVFPGLAFICSNAHSRLFFVCVVHLATHSLLIYGHWADAIKLIIKQVALNKSSLLLKIQK
jgi:hypothetical protein